MATLDAVPFENPAYVGDGSLGDPTTGPYAPELQQQRFLPPPGDYWVRLDRAPWLRGGWEPVRVENSVPLRGFAMIGLHSGETRRWDLSTAEWRTRLPWSG
jgi:hypothetical protein